MGENGIDGTHRLISSGIVETVNLGQLTQDGTVSEHSMDHTELSTTEDSQDESLHDDMVPKIEFQVPEEIDFNLPLKQVLFAMNRIVCQRLDSIENRLDGLNHYCHALEKKVEGLTACLREHNVQIGGKRAGQTVIVGVPHSPGSSPGGSNSGTPYATTIGPKVTLITLNTEADYPGGSWLGDENNPEMRVRCHVTPTDLLHINTTCHTAEKMALTLLDYLFDRETQACSNISGTGKHRKKQLDPLMIYGIRCHLIHKFGITEKDWHRIKQNMDSKCRTAFRRKMKGLSLSVKQAFRDKSEGGLNVSILNDNSMTQVQDSEGELSMDQTTTASEDLEQTHAIAFQQAAISVGDHNDLAAVMEGAQVIHTPQGDIQVLHATPEQIAQIQQTHQIQILTGDHVITAAGDHIIQEVQEATHLVQNEDGIIVTSPSLDQ